MERIILKAPAAADAFNSICLGYLIKRKLWGWYKFYSREFICTLRLHYKREIFTIKKNRF